MTRYALAIDISRCDGCGSCFMACKDEHIGNEYRPFSAAQPRQGQQWLRLEEIEQGQGSKVKVDYLPIMCQHCQNPPCAQAAPAGAVVRRSDGVVILDPARAKGCQDLPGKCPYGAIFWNEELKIPQKCGMCAQLLDSGEMTTRCAECCPTQALMFGDLDDPASTISRYVAERGDFTPLRPELGTEPTVLYRELPSPFITGEVVLADKPNQCCEGATVTCSGADGSVRRTLTDFMGDFQFKGLKADAKYRITVSLGGYAGFEEEIVVQAAKDLGIICLRGENPCR